MRVVHSVLLLLLLGVTTYLTVAGQGWLFWLGVALLAVSSVYALLILAGLVGGEAPGEGASGGGAAAKKPPAPAARPPAPARPAQPPAPARPAAAPTPAPPTPAPPPRPAPTPPRDAADAPVTSRPAGGADDY